jgi:hypothetical protein
MSHLSPEPAAPPDSVDYRFSTSGENRADGVSILKKGVTRPSPPSIFCCYFSAFLAGATMAVGIFWPC